MSGKLIYITGLSGSGKTTISKELQKLIPNSILLDGDEIRNTINKDIGYDRESKIKNISRNNELIKLLYNQGFTIIAAFMASVSSERDKIFTMCNNNVKIQLTTPIDVCISRDPKGLYSKNLNNFSGVNFKYDMLSDANLYLDTTNISIEESVKKVYDISIKLQ